MKFSNKNKVLSLILAGSYTFGMYAQAGFASAVPGDACYTKPVDAVVNDMPSATNDIKPIGNLNLKKSQNSNDKIKNYVSLTTSMLNLIGRTVIAYSLIKGLGSLENGLKSVGAVFDSIDRNLNDSKQDDSTRDDCKRNYSEFNFVLPGDINVSFDNISGYENVKREFLIAIDRLKNYEAYNKSGIKSRMQGVILYGPPGTGKTMFAKAVARAANVPFFNVAGSEFVKLYVGNGADRVRKLFAEVKKYKKCVVFIDEIDAVGGKRGGGSSGDSERDQTLNQLLTCLTDLNSQCDGSFLVIVATNRLDSLDDAFTRSGRFNQKIEIGLPNEDERKSIIEKYSLQYNGLLDNIGMTAADLAGQTKEFSGADINTLLELCAVKLTYSRNNGETIDVKPLLDSELENIKKNKQNKKIKPLTGRRKLWMTENLITEGL